MDNIINKPITIDYFIKEISVYLPECYNYIISNINIKSEWCGDVKFSEKNGKYFDFKRLTFPIHNESPIVILYFLHKYNLSLTYDKMTDTITLKKHNT